jgi:predicted dithiol-disulfide oxidoreductase (DUF899 family)
MADHRVATREEWLTARLELLAAEKEHTRRGDELAKRRQELPWVLVDKDYRFTTEEGEATLADLFGGRSQLLVYHFMFGADYENGCKTCSTIADGFNGSVVHLRHHDVAFWAISRAPLPKIQAYKQRMRWSFPWASSYGSDFNLDFQAGLTEEQQRAGEGTYNFAPIDLRKEIAEAAGADWPKAFLEGTGTDWATYRRESPGLSAFVRDGGAVYHTYSAYGRGIDAIWGMYQLLDRAPRGRNEDGTAWWHRRDEYEPAEAPTSSPTSAGRP